MGGGRLGVRGRRGRRGVCNKSVPIRPGRGVCVDIGGVNGEDRGGSRKRSPRRAVAGERNNDRGGGSLRSPRHSGRDEGNVDRRAGKVASAQEGAIGHDQLLDVGLGRDAIDHWVHRGRLHVRHRGVYVLGHTAPAKYTDEMAAVLACRPRALISHATAAYMWGFRPKPADGIIDVTVVGRKARHRRGIRTHRAQTLMRADLSYINNVPVTPPARALLEIAPALTVRELELALHEALAQRKTTIAQVRAVLRRYPRRRGSARLKSLVDQSRSKTLTDSKAAERLYRHLRCSGLPQPLVDIRRGRWRPDFYWPEARLVVEVDGGDFHSSRPRIERDHRKDADLKSMGEDVLRFTGRQVQREIEFVLVTIGRTYERRASELSPRRTGS